jgi:hypothetical protein
MIFGGGGGGGMGAGCAPGIGGSLVWAWVAQDDPVPVNGTRPIERTPTAAQRSKRGLLIMVSRAARGTWLTSSVDCRSRERKSLQMLSKLRFRNGLGCR